MPSCLTLCEDGRDAIDQPCLHSLLVWLAQARGRREYVAQYGRSTFRSAGLVLVTVRQGNAKKERYHVSNGQGRPECSLQGWVDHPPDSRWTDDPQPCRSRVCS